MRRRRQHKLVLAIAGVVTAAGVFLMAPATLASAAGFSDSVFAPGDWTHSILWSVPTVSLGPMAQVTPGTKGQTDCRGKPGYYQQGRHTSIGSFAGLYDGHTYVGAPAYDPATKGAIASMDVSYCLKNIVGSAIQDGLLIQQGTRTFIYFVDSAGPYPAWKHLGVTGITNVWNPAWVEIGPGNTIIDFTTPDFSAKGLPIRCGYYTFNWSLAQGFSIDNTWGIDDWACTIHPVAIKIATQRFRAQEGAQFSGPVATFSDSNLPSATPGQYTATVNWGDSSSSAGTISGPAGGPFVVNGTHTYAEEGSYTVTVTITQTVNPTNTATVSYSVPVGTVPINISCAKPVKSWMNFSGTVFTFAHVNAYEPNGLAEFGATINWGGSEGTSSGTVSGNPSNTGPSYKVTASHNFHSVGPQTITVTVTDDAEKVSKTCEIYIRGKESTGLTVTAANHDVWLAGASNGTTDNFTGDVAPAQSPFLAGGPSPVVVIGGQYLEFENVTGTPNFDGGAGVFPHDSDCDGVHHTDNVVYFPSFTHNGGSANGIADLTAPANSLIGVFLAAPPSLPLPPALDFSLASSRTFSSVSPALNQPFFVGDGLTGDGTGTLQQFVIPAGATKLYLGTMDRQMWSDNTGQCTIGDVLTSDP